MRYILLIFFVFKKLSAESNATCGMIPFMEWAGSKNNRMEPLSGPIDLVIIQHTALEPCSTDQECVTALRALRTLHLSRGFTDIGISFIVGGNGKVYEGAGWRYVGAHTQSYNKRSIGVSFIGDFREKLPTPAALQATKAFLSCAENNSYLTKDYSLLGHRQLSRTESPGTTLQTEIQSWPHWMQNIKS